MEHNFFLPVVKKVFAVLFVLLTSFLLLELSLQTLLGDSNDDGQFSVRNIPIKPYALPVKRTQQLLDKYYKADQPYKIPDPLLGWTLASNITDSSGVYRTNSIGLRSDIEFTLQSDPETTRIALFGDSFVHGDEIPLEQTFGHILQQKLTAASVNAEVMNFGVSAYGNDQAYLRWKHHGLNYLPDVVIVGFQPENCLRNVNIFRQLYLSGSGIPFSKPRFVLQDNELHLVNSPTVEVQQLPTTIARLRSSEWAEYEYFFNPGDYDANWFNSRFRTVNTVRELLSTNFKRTYESISFSVDSKMMKLCQAIIERFVSEASESSRVFLLHLPLTHHLESALKGEDMAHAETLDLFKQSMSVIDPLPELVSKAKSDSISMAPQGHYTGENNSIVASVIEQHLRGTDVFKDSWIYVRQQ